MNRRKYFKKDRDGVYEGVNPLAALEATLVHGCPEVLHARAARIEGPVADTEICAASRHVERRPQAHVPGGCRCSCRYAAC
jgi:hypothetical protein